MGSFVLAVDPVAQRRKAFRAAARELIAPVPGLSVREAEWGEAALVWAVNPQLPHETRTSPRGSGLLLGYAVGPGDRWQSLEELLALWSGSRPDDAVPPNWVCDGFFGACVATERDGLLVACDPFGIFPLYYANLGDVVLIGNSAWPFRAHPHFRDEFDPRGLAGILVSNGLIGGRTLQRGVLRVAAGNWLAVPPGEPARELRAYRLPEQEVISPSAQTFEESKQLVDQALRAAFARHRPPDGSGSLMLSGGLDSRLVAGYLDQAGLTQRAMTMGHEYDFEFKAARKVAKTLGWTHDREPDDLTPEQFRELARRTARWEQLASGFGFLESWSNAAALGQKGRWFWSGNWMDVLVGGEGIHWSWDRRLGRHTVDRMWVRLLRWGMAPEQVDRLLGQGPGVGLGSEVAHELRAGFRPGRETLSQWSIRAITSLRMRFHLGPWATRFSFNAWPLSVGQDRRLVELIHRLPWQHLVMRRLELALVRDHFPKLAAIPRDSNSWRRERIAEPRTWLERLAVWCERQWFGLHRVHEWYWHVWRGVEPRRYQRCYDLSAPTWKAVRDEAERFRGNLSGLVDLQVLDQLLPGPEMRINDFAQNPQNGARRNLLGLLIWSAQRSASSALKRAA